MYLCSVVQTWYLYCFGTVGLQKSPHVWHTKRWCSPVFLVWCRLWMDTFMPEWYMRASPNSEPQQMPFFATLNNECWVQNPSVLRNYCRMLQHWTPDTKKCESPVTEPLVITADYGDVALERRIASSDRKPSKTYHTIRDERYGSSLRRWHSESGLW